MKLEFQPVQHILSGNEDCRILSAEPSSSLRDVVYRYLQVSTSGPMLYPFVPDASQAIFLSSESFTIGGAQLTAKQIPLPCAGDYFGIWSHPGGLHQLLGKDSSELNNGFVNADWMESCELQFLQEKVYSQIDFPSRVRECNLALSAQQSSTQSSRATKALKQIIKSTGNCSIEALSAEMTISSRQLRRQFLIHFGLTPKTLCQLVQIHHCSHLLSIYDTVSEAAHCAGYSDQSHLIKAFQRFFNCSPSEYMSDFYKPQSHEVITLPTRSILRHLPHPT